MLQISVRPLMAQRGIKERIAFLQKQGLSFYAARHLAGGHMRYLIWVRLRKFALHWNVRQMILFFIRQEMSHFLKSIRCMA